MSDYTERLEEILSDDTGLADSLLQDAWNKEKDRIVAAILYLNSEYIGQDDNPESNQDFNYKKWANHRNNFRAALRKEMCNGGSNK